MRDEFLNALVDCLAGSSEELDEGLAADWDLVFLIVFQFYHLPSISFGQSWKPTCVLG